MRRVIYLCVAAVSLMLLDPGSSKATPPGPNGWIAFNGSDGASSPMGSINYLAPDGSLERRVIIRSNATSSAWSPNGDQIAYRITNGIMPNGIYISNADGTGQRALGYSGDGPAWSPDGTRIAFAQSSGIFTAKIDGSDLTQVTNTPNLDVYSAPSWSPDGTKIAFSAHRFNQSFLTEYDIYVINVDGTGLTQLTTTPVSDFSPDWAPDGTKVVFQSDFADAGDLSVINSDGSGLTLVYDGAASGPVWSPDGTKIAFSTSQGDNGSHIWTINPDGSNQTQLSSGAGNSPAWGSATIRLGYPRPKGATPTRVPLVPAYNLCFFPNSTHGSPLSYPSCSPPSQMSGTLTVGTPDANGAQASSIASATLSTIVGNPATPADEADVAIGASITDVRCRQSNAACPDGAGSDYAGRLLLTNAFQLTDKLNGPPPNDQGTLGQQVTLRIPFACAQTADPDTGSSCSVSTSADTIVPGVVPEGKRSIWQVGELQIYDAGPNGTGYETCPPTCGNGDETLFMRPGVFVP